LLKRERERRAILVAKMNSLGLNIIMRMGCLCSKESVRLNGKLYYVRERLGEGYVIYIKKDVFFD
jgi:hypothetical protein